MVTSRFESSSEKTQLNRRENTETQLFQKTQRRLLAIAVRALNAPRMLRGHQRSLLFVWKLSVQEPAPRDHVEIYGNTFGTF